MALVTLTQVKTYMGLSLTSTANDDELNRLIASATAGVEVYSWATLTQRTFTERFVSRGQVLLRSPLVSVQSFGLVGYDGVVTAYGTPAGYAVIDGSVGLIRSPYSSGTVEVAYTAGLSTVPDEAVDAALVWISYKYRRNHGGTETFMPSGDNTVAAPMGTRALAEQVRLALGQYASAGRVA